MQLELDQNPTHQSLGVRSTSTSSTMPIKLKQLDGDLKSPNKSSNFNNGDGKSKQPPLESKPCRYFASDKGAKLAKVASRCMLGSPCRTSRSGAGSVAARSIGRTTAA